MSERPSIAIITATYKRPEVTELFVYGIRRLRNAIGEEFPVIVTGDRHPIFKDENIEFHPQHNEPVSEKFNVSLHYAMEHNPKHIMVLGSDNLIETEIFTDLIEFKDRGKGLDVTGFKIVYFYSLSGETKGKLVRQNSSIRAVIGAGRTMSYGLVKRSLPLCGKLWDKPKNRSLDNMMWNNIQRQIKRIDSHPGYVIDVKTEQNINPFGLWKGLKSDMTETELMIELSVKEREAIKRIKDK